MLQNVLAGLHDARQDDFEEKTLNQSYRFASYKQFSWWLLGKEIEEWYNLVLWSIPNLFQEPDNKCFIHGRKEKLKKCQKQFTQRCSVKKVFSEVLQNSQGNTCARVFLINFQASTCNFTKNKTLTQVFSCEFCKISKNTFSYRTPPVAASELYTICKMYV